MPHVGLWGNTLDLYMRQTSAVMTCVDTCSKPVYTGFVTFDCLCRCHHRVFAFF